MFVVVASSFLVCVCVVFKLLCAGVRAGCLLVCCSFCCRLLSVVCCLLFVVCCLLCVVCCLLCVV